MPPGMTVDKITVDGVAQAVIDQGINKKGCNMTLPKDRRVSIAAQFHK